MYLYRKVLVFIVSSFLLSEEVVLTFTNCGQEGRYGPSQEQCDSEYAGTNLEDLIILNDGIQEWVVLEDGTYTIEVFGAQGGDELYDSGGLGAKMSGDFVLFSGDTLRILVGQRTEDLPSLETRRSAGGGGGSFVVSDVNPIIIAAGGGGASSLLSDYIEGNSSENGSNGGDGSGVGGSGGSGGSQGVPAGGAGGAGWFSNGSNGDYSTNNNTGGIIFLAESGVNEGHGYVVITFDNDSGCMDPYACNYDSEALEDDGNCAYEYDCAGVCGGDAYVDDAFIKLWSTIWINKMISTMNP